MATEVRKPEDLARLIRAQRKKQKLTQSELAGASGTGLRFIVDAEKGKPTLQLGKLLRVLHMLGLSLAARGGDE
jgi:HTH-type transcriptional regulator / antitoxin HipB